MMRFEFLFESYLEIMKQAVCFWSIFGANSKFHLEKAKTTTNQLWNILVSRVCVFNKLLHDETILQDGAAVVLRDL